jgi:hypothetical protein
VTLILSVLATFAALAGLLNRSIYDDALATGVHPEALMAGTISQDIISVLAGVILAILSIVFIRRSGNKLFIVMLGLTGHFFYGYGLYSIQGLYTTIYFVYLLIFGLSVFSLVYGLTSFKLEVAKQYRLPGALRKSTGIVLILVVLVFVSLWLAVLIPNSLKNVRPDAYGVFVLDLAVIMPALGIVAVKLLRNKAFGNIMAGITLVWILTLILSVVIGESFAPLYGMQVNYGMIATYSLIVIYSLWASFLYLRNLEKEE